VRGVAALGRELDADAGVAVADPAFEPAGGRDRFADEADALHAAFPGPQPGGLGAVEGDEQRVVARALARDHVGLVLGVRREADAAALADGVVVQAAVLADDLAVGRADDRARVLGHVGGEEVGHLHLADEADALAVLLAGGGQAGGGGKFAQRGLGEVADREKGVAELRLGEQGEEIGLILVFVGAFKEDVLCSRAR